MSLAAERTVDMGRGEAARLGDLLAMRVLDTEPESAFDDLAAAAAAVAGLPTALVSLLDGQRQWFKARVGTELCATSRDVAFCDEVVRSGTELEVEDATLEPRFRHHPLVVGKPGIRYYAGFPLRSPAGHVLGTLCVLGDRPHTLDDGQRRVLRTLAHQVGQQLELRRRLLAAEEEAVARAAQEVELARERRADAERRVLLDAVLAAVDVGVVACDADGRLTLFNSATRRFHGLPLAADLDPSRWAEHYDLFAADGRTPLAAADVPLIRALAGEEVRGAIITIAPRGLPARLVSCDGHRLCDEAGTPLGAVLVMTDVTERTRMTRDLQQSRDQAQAVVHSAADAYVEMDVAGRITEWNPQATATFGWSPAQALGQDLADLLIPADHRAAHRRGLQRFLQDGTAPLFGLRPELAAVHRDGHEVPVELSIWPTRDLDGWRFHAFLRDISERAEAAQKLERAHDDLTEALDAMPRSVTLVEVRRDAAGDPQSLQVRWVNRFARTVVGRGLADLVDRPFRDAFPVVAEHYEQRYLDVARTGQPLHLPVEWFAGQKVAGAFEVTVVPWSEDGLLIDAADVTDQRAAECALRASEERLRHAQELAGIGAWEWNLVTGAMSWSPRVYAMFGVDPSVPATSSLFLRLLHPEDRAGFRAQGERGLRDGGTSTVEHRILRPDGVVVHVQAWVSFECDPAGRPVRMWGTSQDVSASRAREQVLTTAAHTDALTGALNRRGWDALAPGAAAAARAQGRSVAVLALDLDHFKALNDAHGHAAGDALLQGCCHGWQGRLRVGDLLARTGGEEFAVLLLGCDSGGARRTADNLRAAVPVGSTASVGATVLGPGETLEAALGRADQALYAAKRAGRNRTVTGPAPAADAGRRLASAGL